MIPIDLGLGSKCKQYSMWNDAVMYTLIKPIISRRVISSKFSLQDVNDDQFGTLVKTTILYVITLVHALRR